MTAGEAISYDVVGNTVTFSAVVLPDTLVIAPLKTLNSVLPANNNDTVSDSSLIKVTPSTSALKFAMIGANNGGNTELFTVIPTTP